MGRLCCPWRPAAGPSLHQHPPLSLPTPPTLLACLWQLGTGLRRPPGLAQRGRLVVLVHRREAAASADRAPQLLRELSPPRSRLQLGLLLRLEQLLALAAGVRGGRAGLGGWLRSQSVGGRAGWEQPGQIPAPLDPLIHPHSQLPCQNHGSGLGGGLAAGELQPERKSCQQQWQRDQQAAGGHAR